jgi:hypothetical protein
MVKLDVHECVIQIESGAGFYSNQVGNRDIFIFDGGNKRLRNVTNLYCQCQISQRRS